MPTAEECPTMIACMYCPFFHLKNPIRYLAGLHDKITYECRLPKKYYGLKWTEIMELEKQKEVIEKNAF